ncbi:hypothetical protein PWEIH_00050 [Listeria weihenstephanensis FSL R9-0317]|uniref:DUF1294 domain-containing protein n=1 Tax=Listeria weihenstephanensis TaxID=1006155 RepID=UPI0003E849D0|nr:DUF1294 domain-containing protein [Listeria weihenstephanensis]EUJ41412.1 hypothetical protein PWEIH_00050 [Listeria weihenstephanensis FSL R9-0317]
MLILLASAYYLMMNVIGFSTMAIDKSKAVKHQWRIPEATLLLCAFFGWWHRFLDRHVHLSPQNT